jgi:predicted deacylase
VSALDPYPDPDARERELDELAAAASRRIAGVELLEYGRSVEGRPLRAVRIPRQGGNSGPRVLVCANTHGPEFIGNRVCTALLREASQRDGALDPLLARAQLWLVPCINPDGYARTYARDGVGELPSLRHNQNGVDLNRNWPLPEGGRRLPLPGAGSMRPGDATYCGPHPLSEPETASLDRLLAEQDFHASANLHSFMGTLFPARVTDGESFRRYRSLCEALSRAQPRVHYRWLASRHFDTFTGEQEDHQHHTRRCWAVCVESFPLRASFAQHLRAPSLFWRFNPRDPGPWVENDVPGIVAFLLAALELPRAGQP